MIPAAVTERQLQDWVIELIKRLGLHYYHTHDSRRSPAGFPDLVIWGPRGLVMREMKSARGRLTPEQQETLRTLDLAGADVGVWRPEGWPDRITAELQALRLWPRGKS